MVSNNDVRPPGRPRKLIRLSSFKKDFVRKSAFRRNRLVYGKHKALEMMAKKRSPVVAKSEKSDVLKFVPNDLFGFAYEDIEEEMLDLTSDTNLMIEANNNTGLYAIFDPLGDGNCSYRAIAYLHYGDENRYRDVKKDMLVAFESNKDNYPDCAQVVADAYNIPVCTYGDAAIIGYCNEAVTFLPLGVPVKPKIKVQPYHIQNVRNLHWMAVKFGHRQMEYPTVSNMYFHVDESYIKLFKRTWNIFVFRTTGVYLGILLSDHRLPDPKLLTSPEEWPHLQEMLQCYSLASNAKVNIHKTELVSLSGLENAVWKEIVRTSSIDYHTTASPDAVRYLGYPLYSNQQQLDSFLQTIENKIGNHAFLLKDRHLSVRGSSLIANSLLLSRLWHILRVVPVPNKRLFSIRQVVRKFVLPFWPAPSWDQICLPKSHGDLGVVDPQVQQITLQLIYLRRLMQSKSDTDFVSPLVGASLYLYTGHKSFLPWLPTMQVLTRLIQELPPLKKSSNWSGSFLADTPLSVALIITDPDTVDSVEHLRSDRTFVPSKISINRLVSDVIAWYPLTNQYHNFLQVGLPKQGQPTKVYRLLQQNDGGVSWTSQFSDSMPATNETYSRPPENTPNPSLEHPTYPKWLPSCHHWYIYIDSSHRIMVSQIRNGDFRLHVQLSRKMITTSGNIYLCLLSEG
ncbi:hypothetical protein BDF21DRAFT_450872 [Thamnidium elegans]|nr:hypothetical protein BDF21DRAFT_450872 [Thamnidium elegans]